MSDEVYNVFLRRVPQQFRREGFRVSGNNVFGPSGAGPGMVGQLEEYGPFSVSEEHVSRLLGGASASVSSVMNVISNVAAVANLGVCVAGFTYMAVALKRIEKRIARMESTLEEVRGLVGVIDQKIDQLIDLNEAQLKALDLVHNLIMSFKTAEVHAALETLELRAKSEASPRRNAEIMEACRKLHEYRIWLAARREEDPVMAAPARVELMRAEVIVALAEARARCFVGDAAFASDELERVFLGVRHEVIVMRDWITDINVSSSSDGIAALLSRSSIVDVTECAECWAWIEGKSVQQSMLEMVSVQSIHERDTVSEAAHSEFSSFVAAATRLVEIASQGKDERIVETKLKVPRITDADAASFVAAYRIARDTESALRMCTAMDVGGEPVRALLTAAEAPGSPALVFELGSITAERDDTTSSLGRDRRQENEPDRPQPRDVGFRGSLHSR